MSTGTRHTVLTTGRSSSGSGNLGGGRIGVSTASSGRHSSGGIAGGRADFSGRSHVGGGSTCAYGAGRSHFSSGSCSGAFGAGAHVAGSGGFGAGSVGSSAARSGVVGGAHVGVVGGAHAGMMGGMIGGAHAGMMGGHCGMVGAVPAGMVGGMGAVIGGGHAGMVGTPCGFAGGVVAGPTVVGGLGGDPMACGGVFTTLDGKMTMQNLNDRLASYLDKVRCLEEENAMLESRIREFYVKQGPLCEPKDYSNYHQQIEDIKNQLICTSVENNKLLLCIDNSKLTADDFRTKYETECCLRQNVEADINGLHQILDQLTACRADLEIQCENLQDELCGLKKNHEEEVTCLKNQSTGDVNVEVNACPGPDLRKILEEMRCKYESMIECNRKEVEAWYGSKIEEVNRDVCTSSQEIEESNNKVTELRRQLQALEIDYDAQCSLRDTLEASLGETEHRYNNHLAELQGRISVLEQQLAELRAEMECQNHEYTELLDVKSRLEQEIATYRCLLEGGQHDIVGGGGGAARASSGSTGRTGEVRTSHTYVTHSAGHSFHGGHVHH
ncbi:keratin, type I cytoskeletal 19-like [Eublepharis macularius]|uniref:Keratin, type I cytoskeletal 19-like n=1 Tax=Eublepharis macularius TaxID=481883 RepID=A0AA97K255_EUBMA|nr:keratin, type I cytoskeletal 19-like [Eublepharis macularius]